MTASQGLFEIDQPLVTVARVHIDVDLPHLDRALDYLIPDDLDADVRPGVLVKVRLAGRTHHGWVIERAQIPSGHRKLEAITAVSSPLPVLSAQTYQLAQLLAKRTLSTVSQILSMAVPPRVAGVEKSFIDRIEQTSSEESLLIPVKHIPDSPTVKQNFKKLDESSHTPWGHYEHGQSFLRSVIAGLQPRAVWSPLPVDRDAALSELIAAVHQRHEQCLIIVPTQGQARDLHEALFQQEDQSSVCGIRSAVYHAGLSAGERYSIYQMAIHGDVDVVIGTRSTAWLPMISPGLIIVWDDGDDRLREQRAPRVDSLDIAMARVTLSKCALLLASWSRSVKAQALVESRWAHPLESPLGERRHRVPSIHIEDRFEQEREGVRSAGQISAATQQAIRAALPNGPVLIQVPSSGFIPRISCQQCRKLARCDSCGGQLSVTAEHQVTCLWCGRDTIAWSCQHCSGTELRAVRVGSILTGEHLGRAFPGVPTIQSTARHDVTDVLDHRPKLVIATPGREPRVDGGYELVVVVDPSAIAHRPELWAQEEALRRWLNAFALCAPHGSGRVSGAVDPLLAQSLIRWDAAYTAASLLAERHELGFFPARTIVTLDGKSADVHAILDQCDAEVMGVVPLHPNANHQESSLRGLIRVDHQNSQQLLDQLRSIQQVRSARKLPLVKMTVNPPELFS